MIVEEVKAASVVRFMPLKIKIVRVFLFMLDSLQVINHEECGRVCLKNEVK